MSRWRALARRLWGHRAVLDARVESFNLLPYRPLRALRARRRCRSELAGAVLLGLACATVLAAWHERGAKRLLEQRAVLQQALERLAPQLAESARLAALQRAGREQQARQAAAAGQRQRLTDLLAASSRGATLGIALADLRQRADAATLQGQAVSHAVLEQWIHLLGRLPGVDTIGVTRLRGMELVATHAAKTRGVAVAGAGANNDTNFDTGTDIGIDTGAVTGTGTSSDTSTNFGTAFDTSAGIAGPTVEFDLRIAYRVAPAAAPRRRAAAAGVPIGSAG
jgi:Tfp pilus assembly protein PilN